MIKNRKNNNLENEDEQKNVNEVDEIGHKLDINNITYNYLYCIINIL